MAQNNELNPEDPWKSDPDRQNRTHAATSSSEEEFGGEGELDHAVGKGRPLVQINVGGQIFCTHLSTFEVNDPDSILLKFLKSPSSSFELCPPARDSQGNLFWDRDSNLFSQLLHILRTGNVQGGLPLERLIDLKAEAEFFMMFMTSSKIDDAIERKEREQGGLLKFSDSTERLIIFVKPSTSLLWGLQEFNKRTSFTRINVVKAKLDITKTYVFPPEFIVMDSFGHTIPGQKLKVSQEGSVFRSVILGKYPFREDRCGRVLHARREDRCESCWGHLEDFPYRSVLFLRPRDTATFNLADLLQVEKLILSDWDRYWNRASAHPMPSIRDDAETLYSRLRSCDAPWPRGAPNVDIAEVTPRTMRKLGTRAGGRWTPPSLPIQPHLLEFLFPPESEPSSAIFPPQSESQDQSSDEDTPKE